MALGERIPDGEAVDDEPTLAPWVHLALAMEDITIRAQKEFSLNMEDREKAISKGLLTLFFSEAAPETLRTDMAAIPGHHRSRDRQPARARPEGLRCTGKDTGP